jgi:hypothetical protein
MGQLGIAFEPQDYGNLLEVAPHYAGYIFRNETTFNQTVSTWKTWSLAARGASPFKVNFKMIVVYCHRQFDNRDTPR